MRLKNLKRTILAGVLASVATGSSIAQPKPLPQAPADCPPELQFRQPGVKLSLLAEHPQVVTPTGIDVDEEGRIWAVLSHTHFRPDGYAGPKHDEIIVLSKLDPSGGAPTRTVFYDRTTATMDLELGAEGWVYLAERSRILRVKDTDGDGRGDLEEKIAALKTEADYPHNGMAGLAWHPSGDLIFSLGENMWKEWTLTAPDGAALRGSGEGGIFRCRPDGSGLRRIAKGFWNPFGVCVRADGEIFAADNDPGSRPPCRLLHIVEGGDYGYQRAYGEAPFHPFVCWNGELRGTLPMICPTGEAPCGVAPLGAGLVAPSWTDHRIDFFPLRRRGASFTSERVELVSGGAMFRPTSLVRAGEGVYYLTDWVFGSYPVHQRGRVWKLEIDPFAASAWLKTGEPEPLPEAKALASVDARFETARGNDPFLARAALLALGAQAESWAQPEHVAKLPARDRVSAGLALKLARPKDEGWARILLGDPDQRVQFEALRWIADEQLVALLPEVEAKLRDANLDYDRFAASLAAANTLRGHARAGVHDTAMLLDRVRDRNAPPPVRAFALRLLPPRTRELPVSFLRELLALNDGQLAREAVRALSGHGTPEAASVLREVARCESHSPEVKAEALVGLAAQPENDLPLLLELAGDASGAVRDEALRALRFTSLTAEQHETVRVIAREFPGSADAARAILEPATLAAGRPAVSDHRPWQERLEREKTPPDSRAGERIFFHPRLALCSTCHQHSGRGNIVGPDLSAVSRQGDEAWLLGAILEPSRDVAPQFFAISLELKNGSPFVGIMLRDGGGGREFYRDLTGRERAINTADVVSRRELKSSVMPEGLLAMLTDREIRDLLAFLKGPADRE